VHRSRRLSRTEVVIAYSSRLLDLPFALAQAGMTRRLGSHMHLCYPGSTMAAPVKKAQRAGQTEKISVSLAHADLAALRRRARRLYGGNLSAAVAEGVRRIHEEEGREALAAWLGDAGEASPEERDALRAEWRQAEGPAAGKRRKVR